jgi:hypothetical protein
MKKVRGLARALVRGITARVQQLKWYVVTLSLIAFGLTWVLIHSFRIEPLVSVVASAMILLAGLWLPGARFVGMSIRRRALEGYLAVTDRDNPERFEMLEEFEAFCGQVAEKERQNG